MTETTLGGGGADVTISLADPGATAALGARLFPLLQAGDIVALRGDLGMGKTTLVRGLVQRALGPETDVPSPTFTLVQTYDLDGMELWHFDLYRLETPEEVFELGVEEAFIDCISLIEWPDRMGPYLPHEHLEIRLRQDGDGRSAAISGSADWRARLEGLAA